MIKRLGALLMALALSAGMLAAGSAQVQAAQGKRYGLTVAADGTLMLEGKPFYGFGVNLYTSFQHHLENPLNEKYKEEFALMKKYNIPFVRVPFSGYQASYYDQFDADPEMVFGFMDDVVAEAEKQNIGIIASLMWWDPALSAHVGEKRASMGDVNSKTMAYAKKYVAAIVKRYADRPGIWGWEIGNEYNLTADLCDPKLEGYLWPDGLPTMPIEKSGFNYYTSAELQIFYREIAKEIRKYDSYRMISNGNGDMRGASRAMNRASNAMDKSTHLWTIDWTEDSKDDFDYMNAYLTPSPMDTVCFHLQHGTLDGNPPQYVLEFRRWGKTVSTLEYFQGYVSAAKKAKKALYFGEMGDFMDMETAPDLEEKFNQVLDWVTESGIQIASTWQFGASPENLVASDVGREGMKLRSMSERNLAYRKAGKQDLSKAWTDVKPTTRPSDPTTVPTEATTTAPTKVPTGTQQPTRPTADRTDGTTPGSGSHPTSNEGAEVSYYMQTSSTKLTIDEQTDTIVIDKAVALDVFERSIVFRSGYGMKVWDSDNQELSDARATVDSKCTVAVYDPDGLEIRRFRVEEKSIDAAADTTTAENRTTALGGGAKKSGLPVWALVLIITGAVLVLGGGGAGLYFGVLKKRMGR